MLSSEALCLKAVSIHQPTSQPRGGSSILRTSCREKGGRLIITPSSPRTSPPSDGPTGPPSPFRSGGELRKFRFGSMLLI